MDEWQTLRARIEAAPGTLTEGATVVVEEPDGPAPEVRRRFWQRAAAAPAPRYVQVTRWGDALVAEAVSGAYREVPDEQQRAVLALGWTAPSGRVGSTDNCACEASRAEAGQLADRLVRTLAALGGDPGTGWVVRVVD